MAEKDNTALIILVIVIVLAIGVLITSLIIFGYNSRTIGLNQPVTVLPIITDTASTPLIIPDTTVSFTAPEKQLSIDQLLDLSLGATTEANFSRHIKGSGSDFNKHTCPGEWVEDRNVCRCPRGYFGPDCTREKYDKNYQEIGTTELELKGKQINYDLLLDCSKPCDENEKCVGFQVDHSKKICTLLTEVADSLELTFDPNLDSNLYMKSEHRPLFPKKIFLASYGNLLKGRFWLKPNREARISFAPKRLQIIDWLPRAIINDGNYTGVISTKPWDKLPEKDSNHVRIHKPGTKLNLPEHWRFEKKIYVYYY